MTQLLKGRNVGINYATATSHNSQNLQVTSVNLAFEYGGISQGSIDMFTSQSSSNIGRSFRIRNMLKLYAELFLEGQSCNMPNCAYAGVTHLDFAGIGFSEFNEFINTVVGSFLRHNESCGGSDGCANGSVILISVLALTLMGEHSQLHSNHAQGMTISLSIGSFNHTSYTATIRLIHRHKFGALQLFLHELD